MDTVATYLGAVKGIGLSLMLACILWSCDSSYSEQDIVGIWHVDSAYTYYNGFSNMVLDSTGWARYAYLEDGNMKEIKEGSYKPFLYEIVGDTLIHRKPNGQLFTSYQIFKLTADQMVLKKEKPPIFQGGNQERYEIRYFTKGEE